MCGSEAVQTVQLNGEMDSDGLEEGWGRVEKMD